MVFSINTNIRWVDLDDDDDTPVQPAPQLSTRKVPSEEWEAIHDVVEEWLKLANERYEKSEIARLTALRPNKVEHAKLETSKLVITGIHANLAAFKNREPDNESEYWDTILVCEDSNLKIQAIALVHMENLKVVFLATHPDNFISSLRNHDVTPVRGAGTQIMLVLIKEALKTNTSLHIKSTPDAERFYKKIGFVRDIPTKSMFLSLSSARMHELILQKKPPFNQLDKK